MSKVIKIESCSECPYIHTRDYERTKIQRSYYCTKTDYDYKMIEPKDLKEFPEWCPLDNRKEPRRLKSTNRKIDVYTIRTEITNSITEITKIYEFPVSLFSSKDELMETVYNKVRELDNVRKIEVQPDLVKITFYEEV